MLWVSLLPLESRSPLVCNGQSMSVCTSLARTLLCPNMFQYVPIKFREDAGPSASAPAFANRNGNATSASNSAIESVARHFNCLGSWRLDTSSMSFMSTFFYFFFSGNCRGFCDERLLKLAITCHQSCWTATWLLGRSVISPLKQTLSSVSPTKKASSQIFEKDRKRHCVIRCD